MFGLLLIALAATGVAFALMSFAQRDKPVPLASAQTMFEDDVLEGEYTVVHEYPKRPKIHTRVLSEDEL